MTDKEIKAFTKEAKTKVARGVKILDKKARGWAKKIKLSVFTIDSNLDCILAQLGRAAKTSGWDFANKILPKKKGEDSMSSTRLDRYGFESQHNDEKNTILNGIWRDIIQKRQDRAKK